MRVFTDIGIVLSFAFAVNGAWGADLLSYEQLRAKTPASAIQILDRQHKLVQELRVDFSQRRGHWLSLHEISPALQRAVLISEDQRFMDHRGVDWLAAANAAWSQLVDTDGRRGASTLSMQLADLIGQSSGRGARGRTWQGKLSQAYAAYEVEGRYTKSQILEAYLNLAPFRGEIVGVDALARVLFQKHASALNSAEAAIAAAMLRAPNANPATLRQRACAVLAQMGVPEQCKTIDFVLQPALARGGASMWDEVNFAPHFARQLLRRTPLPDPLRVIESSLDYALQREVQMALAGNLHELQRSHVDDAAVVVLSNSSGEVLAYVGASDSSAAAELDHAAARRQAGSTLKPFLYALALSDQRLTAASLLDDSLLSLETANGLYVPQNYDQRFNGWVTVRKALASSLNIPAVRTLTLMPVSDFWALLRALGLPLNHDAEFYGYSLALGSADVDLLSLTNAYRAIANLGCFSPPMWTAALPKVPAPSTLQPKDVSECNSTPLSHVQQSVPASGITRKAQLLAPGAAWIVGDILSDRHARAYTFGLDSPLSTPFWSAVKTGTSKDMRDNWAVGFSRDYTVGVWVGNSDGSPMLDVSGISGAAPVWHQVMGYLHRERPSQQPDAPADVGTENVSFEGKLEPGRTEYFVAGTELTHVRLSEVSGASAALPGENQIFSPTSGTVYAFDPDIPPEHQRLQLRAISDVPVVWRVNGETVANGSVAWWSLLPGRFTIELFDAWNRQLDSRVITVRGETKAQLKPN